MFWFHVTIGILVVSSVWGIIDWMLEVRKVRNKEYEERNVSLCFDTVVRDRTDNFEGLERQAIYEAVTEDTKRKLKRWAERLSEL